MGGRRSGTAQIAQPPPPRAGRYARRQGVGRHRQRPARAAALPSRQRDVGPLSWRARGLARRDRARAAAPAGCRRAARRRRRYGMRMQRPPAGAGQRVGRGQGFTLLRRFGAARARPRCGEFGVRQSNGCVAAPRRGGDRRRPGRPIAAKGGISWCQRRDDHAHGCHMAAAGLKVAALERSVDQATKPSRPRRAAPVARASRGLPLMSSRSGARNTARPALVAALAPPSQPHATSASQRSAASHSATERGAERKRASTASSWRRRAFPTCRRARKAPAMRATCATPRQRRHWRSSSRTRIDRTQRRRATRAAPPGASRTG